MQCKKPRNAIFTAPSKTLATCAVATFILYPTASQVVALPPRRPFLATGQHLGLMCPTLERELLSEALGMCKVGSGPYLVPRYMTSLDYSFLLLSSNKN